MTRLFYGKISNALLDWPGSGIFRACFVLLALAAVFLTENFQNSGIFE